MVEDVRNRLKITKKTDRTLEYRPPPNQMANAEYRLLVLPVDIPPIPSILCEKSRESILHPPFLRQLLRRPFMIHSEAGLNVLRDGERFPSALQYAQKAD